MAKTAKLICVFVFAYANCWFSHEAAHLLYYKTVLFYFSVILIPSMAVSSLKGTAIIFTFNPYLTDGVSHHYQSRVSPLSFLGRQERFFKFYSIFG